jgi:hypothetical protein
MRPPSLSTSLIGTLPLALNKQLLVILLLVPLKLVPLKLVPLVLA